jgi:hypothetical protein
VQAASRAHTWKKQSEWVASSHIDDFGESLHAMTPRQRETFSRVTLGHIRGHGCRNLLVYCESLWCNHSAVMNADGLPDEVLVRSLCPRMVCTACGLVGADVRPDWSPHTNRRQS